MATTKAAKARAKKAAPVTVEAIKGALSYDPDTGSLIWKVRRGHSRIGQRAGSIRNDGYVVVRVFGRLYMAHRIAWAIHEGNWPDDQIDHINGNRSDNRIINLRPCTNAENCQNVRAHRDANSKHVGVCRVGRGGPRPWLAQLCIGGRQRVIGRFATEWEALAARLKAKAELHPFNPTQRIA